MTHDSREIVASADLLLLSSSPEESGIRFFEKLLDYDDLMYFVNDDCLTLRGEIGLLQQAVHELTEEMATQEDSSEVVCCSFQFKTSVENLALKTK